MSSLNHFDLCFSVDNGHDELCAFLLTIIESEKYDKLIQSKWIEQLQQKYADADQVKKANEDHSIEKRRCSCFLE